MCDWALLGPLKWIRHVNRQVMVKTGNGQQGGWLLTVDPVTASLVLLNFREEGGASVQVVMGHAVEEVEVLQEADEETTKSLQSSFLPTDTCMLRPEELKKRRSCVLSWLEKNHVPVEEEGDELRVAGVLTITAPYRPEDCCSSNEIVLGRIQKLIQSSHEPD
ncbi:uncharacterized protein V6R79_011414 [Siganus canaliculatus]